MTPQIPSAPDASASTSGQPSSYMTRRKADVSQARPKTPRLPTVAVGTAVTVNVNANANANAKSQGESFDPVKPASRTPSSESRRKPSYTTAAAVSVDGTRHIPKTPPTEPRRKPTYTSSLNFPDILPAPTYFSAGVNPNPHANASAGANAHGEEGELQRSQRRSKVEALGKLDRAGTPIQLNAGPTATSFLPSSAQPQLALTAGPSAARNPLHRPVVINPPFASSTVKQEAPRHPPPRTTSRLFGLDECPVYYPTADEFTDTMAYIASISEEAKAYGICKIVPPEGWKMPFTLESENFRFKTRLQRLNQLEAASRAKINFLEQLSMFHNQSSEKEVTIPKIDRQPLDLWKLRKEVNKAGGHLELDRTKAWPKITELLGHKVGWANQVRDAYMTIVLPFDRWALRAKSASVSPLTPLNSMNGTRPPAFTTDTPPSPSQQRSAGRMGAVKLSPRTRMSGRVAAHEGNGLATSQPAPLLSMNGLQAAAEIGRPTSTTPSLPTVRINVPGFSTRDGSESELSEEDSVLSDGSPKKAAVSTPEYQKGEVCEVCRGGHAAEKILLCDGCDRGFHTYCLDPPLASVPTNEEWFCTSCLLSQGDDFGFEEGEDHSIASFQARDASFSYHWWNHHRPTSSSPVKAPITLGTGTPIQNKPRDRDPLARNFGRVVVTEDDVEREFWRLTESSTDTVDVEYGADVHSTTHGSAGPTMETHPLNPYAADGWNLNNMPILPDSLLRYIRSDISGMTVPWIYLGMMFSTFCWHNEDHYTYSVNYMYWGETKTWYGIPGSDAEKFEAAMKSEAPELFEQQPGLLFQLVTMMNPGRVRDAGVKVVACDQRPNEFVITFPKAYHCGFNHGINMNEAVNFALPDWLAEGKESVVKYKNYLKPPVFSHDQLLIAITLYSESIRTAIWLKASLTEMVEEETQRRDKFRAAFPLATEIEIEEDGPEETYQCAVCKGFCYLAQVTCSCTKLVACLEHAEQLCSCAKSKRALRKRYTEAQLEEILAIVVARATQPQNWRNKLYSLLEAPRPALKSMRTLLAEGEKIAFPMEETQSLRELVDRANTWVERAGALTTRKTTGRRRKGRKDEDEDEDFNVDRSPEAFSALLEEAERLAFDAPEIVQLKQSLLSIQGFQSEARSILNASEEELDLERCKTVLILGQSLNLDLPEVSAIETIVNRLTWFRKVEEEVDDRSLEYKDTVKLLQQAEACEIPEDHPTIAELKRRREKGAAWLEAVEKLFEAPSITIEDISALIEGQELVPVSIDKMRQLEGIRKTVLGWQSSAKNFLSSNGSALAAARLCKNVSTANAPINRIDIPEIAELQDELDHHAVWQDEIAAILEVPVNKVTSTINYLKREFDSHLSPEDDEPSDEFVCFCRMTPGVVMVTCRTCSGEYHPKCVGVTPKNASNPFQCVMCQRILPGDGPSLNDFAALVVPERWNFKITPSEFTTAVGIVETALRYSETMLKMIDPKGVAEPFRDVDKLQHAIRKIYALPLLYDAYNFATNERFIFVSWLFRRMQDAIKFRAGLITDGVAPKEKTRTRGRKPRFVLAQAYPREFHCICPEHRAPVDAFYTVECTKCGQGYHSSCVKAPVEVSMLRGVPVAQEGENKIWRCPCCSVKEAKYYLKGVEVRVQMREQFGSNDYIDYRATIQDYAEKPVIVHLAPSTEVVLLECTKFIAPILPDEYGRDRAAGEGEDAPRKRRKVRPSEVGLSGGATPSGTGTEVNGRSAPVSMNGHGYSNGYGHGHGTTTNGYPTPPPGSNGHYPLASASSPVPAPAPAPAFSTPAIPHTNGNGYNHAQPQPHDRALPQHVSHHDQHPYPYHRVESAYHVRPQSQGTSSPVYVHASSPVPLPTPAPVPAPPHAQVQVPVPISIPSSPVLAPVSSSNSASATSLSNRQPPPRHVLPMTSDAGAEGIAGAGLVTDVVADTGDASVEELLSPGLALSPRREENRQSPPSMPGDTIIDATTAITALAPAPDPAPGSAPAAALDFADGTITNAASPTAGLTGRERGTSAGSNGSSQTLDGEERRSTELGTKALAPLESKFDDGENVNVNGGIPSSPGILVLDPPPAQDRTDTSMILPGAVRMDRSSSRDSKGSAEDPIVVD